MTLDTFAIWLTIHVIVAPACACADLGVLGSGEKNGEGNLRYGKPRRAGAAAALSLSSTEVCPYASVEVREEYPLTPLRTRVVRLVCWMTATAWCVRMEDRVETMSVD